MKSTKRLLEKRIGEMLKVSNKTADLYQMLIGYYTWQHKNNPCESVIKEQNQLYQEYKLNFNRDPEKLSIFRVRQPVKEFIPKSYSNPEEQFDVQDIPF